ncbi:uncharacterized protein AMSG_05139 [Thecamonas trahens ATCC 50062]|uniref:Uncharacterized protein n=1 Tax=Thecamonas trahens ATCC 50062 TaxID=461836 RepID=A0A0L0DAQ6_THETB|nr:hypothetical protein AMSG_05139 [Thecamonas trahens ATCC 50062]KNC49161.1 hypothetical protein AMSG_05139 [Thecamonas trahens ATCC 50062]|eukprot:XP_013758182.1 hypothetical protein AMSG_05139 [Thecamonas trahens ATCC 50062]
MDGVLRGVVLTSPPPAGRAGGGRTAAGGHGGLRQASGGRANGWRPAPAVTNLGIRDLAFVRRVALCEEIRKSRPKVESALDRHKRWLAALGKYRKEAEGKAEVQEKEEAIRRARFKQREHAKRMAITGREEEGEEEKEADQAPEHAADQVSEPVDGDNGVASDGELELDDDEAVDDLLSFADALDYDRYMGELDIKAGIEQLKTRAAYTAEHPEADESGPASEPGSAGEGSESSEADDEPCKANAVPVVSQRSLLTSAGVSSALTWVSDDKSATASETRGPGWNPSTRIDSGAGDDGGETDSVMSEMRRVPQPLRQKHSKASLAQVAARLASAAFEPDALRKHLPVLLRTDKTKSQALL